MDSLVLLCFLLPTVQGFLLDREVCYGDLGCFNTQTVRSFSRPIVLLPSNPSSINTTFFLYTKKNPNQNVEQILNRKIPKTISDSNFEAGKPVKFIIHGFTHDAHQPWVQKMVAELLRQGDMNVIAVDWSGGSGFPYTRAAANIRVVAAELAKLIQSISSLYPLDFSVDSVHMIGHSLGAMIAGEAGYRVPGIGRISGMDPAQPYFEGPVERARLDPKDAKFVDVIHSDAEQFLLSIGLGYTAPLGHVDFYVNGGGDQPGCTKTLTGKLALTATKLLSGYDAVEKAFACSHLKSVDYFTESINSQCPFAAFPCDNYKNFKAGKCMRCSGKGCSSMGYHADQYPGRGSMYLLTNQKGTPPFCNYHYGIKVVGGLQTSRAYGKLSVELFDDKKISLGKIDMTNNMVSMKSKEILRRLITSPKHLGEITQASITFTPGTCLLCLTSKSYRLKEISIEAGEDMKVYRFCGNNSPLNPRKPTVLSVSSSPLC